jgi:hypothetical protein
MELSAYALHEDAALVLCRGHGTRRVRDVSTRGATVTFSYRLAGALCHRQSRHGPQNRLISYRPDPAELIGLANIKENKWRDLSWCMEDFPAHGFGCH